MNKIDRWHEHYMGMAKKVASDLSKDRSTKVGCVITTLDHIVLSTGFNGFPRGCFDSANDVLENGASVNLDSGEVTFTSGVSTTELGNFMAEVEARHDRPAKYFWTEHSERNAVYNAAREGVRLKGARIYVPWFPCVDCARAIIQSGLVEIVAYKPNFEDERWGAQFVVAAKMLSEAGVSVVYVEQKTGS